MLGKIASFILLLLGTTACCYEEWQFRDEISVGIHEIIYDEGISPHLVADTITKAFFYNASCVYAMTAAAPVLRPSQILLAMSCDENYDRVLVKESVRVYLDQPITVLGATVLPGSDLLQVIADFPVTDAYASVGSTGVQLQFNDGFLEVSEIPRGVYTFTFEGMLEDGELLMESTSVYLDL